MDDQATETSFDFLQEPRDVLKALLECREHGTLIGIKALILGKGMFVTGVEDILIGDGSEDTRIILKGYDFTGHVLPINTIRLTDIEGVCEFSSKFGNPILKTLSKILKM
jgi:hypothetical protein